MRLFSRSLPSPADLARETGIAVNHLGKYLHTLVELRLVRRVLSEDVPDRTGYEELARRTIAEAGDRRQLPFSPLYIGRAWDRRGELDVIAISHRERVVLVGECKWQASKMSPSDLTGLRERAEALKRLRGFKKHYALFSRSGFTKPLERQAHQQDVLLFEGPEFQRIVG